MRRRSRLALLAVAAGLIVPTAVNSSAATAVDQDLTLSVTSGAAGTVVTTTSASCVTTDTETGFSYLSVRFHSGTGADEVLAGIGLGLDDQDAAFVVPDWIDPTDPAVVEASCITFDFSGTEPTTDSFAYDPVPFDVEASPGSPVQTSTYSRTSLQAGQAFSVDGGGCFIDNAQSAYAEVAQGADLSFRTAENFVARGATDVDGDAFSVPTAMSNGGLGISVSQTGDDTPVVDQIEETPTDIPAGTYTSISYCSDDDGVTLLYPPQLIDVTGNAPFGDIDLTVPAQSRTATLAGGSCTTGDASVELLSTDISDLFEDIPVDEPLVDPANAIRTQSPAAIAALSGPARNESRIGSRAAWARSQGARVSGRALADDEFVDATVTPGADGAWAFSDDAGFDNGFVEGYAWCGDPLADGYIYDPQGAAVLVTPQETTTTTTTTVPVPVPAAAVQGQPTYAG